MSEYNEAQRNSNEIERIAQETERIKNEANRITNEIERQAREDIRATNENNRINEYNTFMVNIHNAENERMANEVNRQEAEEVRIEAENERAEFYDGFNDRLNAVNSQLAHIAIDFSNFERAEDEANDTGRIQRAIDYASQKGLNIIDNSSNTYVVDRIRLKKGLKSFIVKGIIKGTNSSNYGIIEIDGQYKFQGEKVKNLTISVNLDMSAGDSVGIYADDIENCIIENCNIKDFKDGNGLKKYGIILGKGCKNNKIRNNALIGNLDSIDWEMLIVTQSDSIAWGGYFDNKGEVVRATTPTTENEIINNTCINGTHGISLNGAEKTLISGNICKAQSHRNIVLEPVCFYNTVSNNILQDCGSSSILLGYGCCYNLISNNNCIDDGIFPANAEANINICVGNSYNKIIGNKIKSKRNFNIYLGVNCSYNIIENNEVEDYRRAGIALESDWIPNGGSWNTDRVLPEGAKFSRPNYGAPPTYSDGTQCTQWAFSDMVGNIIQGNVFRRGSSSYDTELYLCQMGSVAGLNSNVIKDNIFHSVLTNKHHIYEYEDVDNKFTNNILTNNKIPAQDLIPSKLPINRKHYKDISNNTYINDSSQKIPINDTTPDVSLGYEFWLQNTSETTITNFINGNNGQEILIRLDNKTTIAYSSANIRPKGLMNISPQTSNCFVVFRNITGIWFEVARNF